MENEFYEDIIEIALYGSIDYWCMTYNPTTKEMYYENPEADGYLTAILDIELIKKGIEKVLTDKVSVNKSYKNDIMLAVFNKDAGYIDAISADIIVQAGLFNDVVYG
jgi:hypothetical protein